MAGIMAGNKIVFRTSDSVTLNCPIKKIVLIGGNAGNLLIDGQSFYFSSAAREYVFPSLNGYPGSILTLTSEITGSFSVEIAEIGDVLNPNYFKEDIRNWNGQSVAAVAQSSDTATAPTVAKATRSKKS